VSEEDEQRQKQITEKLHLVVGMHLRMAVNTEFCNALLSAEKESLTSGFLHVIQMNPTRKYMMFSQL
jgi:hypothetical protein